MTFSIPLSAPHYPLASLVDVGHVTTFYPPVPPQLSVATKARYFTIVKREIGTLYVVGDGGRASAGAQMNVGHEGSHCTTRFREVGPRDPCVYTSRQSGFRIDL